MASVFSSPGPVDVDGELVLLLPRREEEGGAAAVAVEGGGGPHVVLPEGVPVQLGGDSIDIRNLIKARLRVHVKAGVKDAFRKAPDRVMVKAKVRNVHEMSIESPPWNLWRNFFLHGGQACVSPGTSSEASSMCHTFLCLFGMIWLSKF